MALRYLICFGIAMLLIGVVIGMMVGDKRFRNVVLNKKEKKAQKKYGAGFRVVNGGSNNADLHKFTLKEEVKQCTNV